MTTPLLADVVPRCGGPQVTEQAPGEWCGHHGPQHRGDCRPPGACFEIEDGGHTCTATCASDSDCASLGAGFTCSARGKPYASDGSAEPRQLCRPPEPAAAAAP